MESVSLTFIFISALSACLCGVLIFSYIRYPALRKWPAELIFWRAICDLGFALQFVVFNAANADNTSGQSTVSCTTSSFLMQFCGFGSLSWYFVFSLNFYLSVANPFARPQLRALKYHAWVWGISFVTACMAASNSRYRPALHMCWTPSENGVNPLNWLVFIGWVLTYWVVSVGALFAVWWRLRAHGGWNSRLVTHLKSRQKALKQSLVFVLVFSVFWGFVGLFYFLIFNFERSHLQPDGTSTIAHSDLYIYFAGALASLGTVDFVVWVYTQREAFRNRVKHKSLSDLMLAKPVIEPDISSSLREEFVYFAVLGIRASIDKKLPRSHHHSMDGDAPPHTQPIAFADTSENRGRPPAPPLATAGSSASLLMSPSNAVSSPMHAVAGGGDDGVEVSVGSNHAGGGPAAVPMDSPARRAKQHAAARASIAGNVALHVAGLRHRSYADGADMSQLDILLDTPWEQKFDAAEMAQRTAAAQARRQARRGVNPTGASAPVRPDASHDERTPGERTQQPIVFREYMPKTFSALRRHVFQLSNAQYLENVGTDVHKMKSDFSEGRSGSFFFRTRRYMVKTLEEHEYMFLRAIMAAYFNYLKTCYRRQHQTPSSNAGPRRSSAAAPQQPPSGIAGSLLARIFGCYSITSYGVTQYFCVMEDLLYNKAGVKARDVFDLKGSWVDRNGGGTSGNTLKDNDWKQKLHVSYKHAVRLLEQVLYDAVFLQSVGIMDYSILLGVHNCAELNVADGNHCSGYRRHNRVLAANPHLSTDGSSDLRLRKPTSRDSAVPSRSGSISGQRGGVASQSDGGPPPSAASGAGGSNGAAAGGVGAEDAFSPSHASASGAAAAQTPNAAAANAAIIAAATAAVAAGSRVSLPIIPGSPSRSHGPLLGAGLPSASPSSSASSAPVVIRTNSSSAVRFADEHGHITAPGTSAGTGTGAGGDSMYAVLPAAAVGGAVGGGAAEYGVLPTGAAGTPAKPAYVPKSPQSTAAQPPEHTTAGDTYALLPAEAAHPAGAAAQATVAAAGNEYAVLPAATMDGHDALSAPRPSNATVASGSSVPPPPAFSRDPSTSRNNSRFERQSSVESAAPPPPADDASSMSGGHVEELAPAGAVKKPQSSLNRLADVPEPASLASKPERSLPAAAAAAAAAAAFDSVRSEQSVGGVDAKHGAAAGGPLQHADAKSQSGSSGGSGSGSGGALDRKDSARVGLGVMQQKASSAAGTSAEGAHLLSEQELRDTPFHKRYFGGLCSSLIDGPGIYYLGVIDMLQSWSWEKRIERYLKQYLFLKDPYGISALPPYPYAQRFILMMRSHLDVSLCALRNVPGVTLEIRDHKRDKSGKTSAAKLDVRAVLYRVYLVYRYSTGPLPQGVRGDEDENAHNAIGILPDPTNQSPHNRWIELDDYESHAQITAAACGDLIEAYHHKRLSQRGLVDADNEHDESSFHSGSSSGSRSGDSQSGLALGSSSGSRSGSGGRGGLLHSTSGGGGGSRVGADAFGSLSQAQQQQQSRSDLKRPLLSAADNV